MKKTMLFLVLLTGWFSCSKNDLRNDIPEGNTLEIIATSKNIHFTTDQMAAISINGKLDFLTLPAEKVWKSSLKSTRKPIFQNPKLPNNETGERALLLENNKKGRSMVINGTSPCLPE